MIHCRLNFCRQDPAALVTVSEGDEFRECDLTQESPDTPICEGIKNLSFIFCRLDNCVVPEDAIIEEGCPLRQITDYVVEPSRDEVLKWESQRSIKEACADSPADAVDVEIAQVVERMAALSFAYPEKVSTKLKSTVDLATVEGLLSADGKAVEVTEKP